MGTSGIKRINSHIRRSSSNGNIIIYGGYGS
nr:MAG TPA: hypothetical protein [Bacteriophage sp.]